MYYTIDTITLTTYLNMAWQGLIDDSTIFQIIANRTISDYNDLDGFVTTYGRAKGLDMDTAIDLARMRLCK